MYLHLSSYLNGVEPPPIRESIKDALYRPASKMPGLRSNMDLASITEIALQTAQGRLILDVLKAQDAHLFVVPSPLNNRSQGCFGETKDTKGTFRHINLEPDECQESMAGILVHEASHFGVSTRILSALGGGSTYLLNRLELSLSDRGLISQADEAVARVSHIVHAFQRKQVGVDIFWQKIAVADDDAPLCAAFAEAIDAGHAPDSPEAKRAIFNAYLLQSPVREAYDLRFLRMLSSREDIQGTKAALHPSSEVIAGWLQGDGQDYLDGVNLRTSDYKGVWDEVETHDDIASAILDLTLKVELMPKAVAFRDLVTKLATDPGKETYGVWDKVPRRDFGNNSLLPALLDIVDEAKFYHELAPTVGHIFVQLNLAREANADLAEGLASLSRLGLKHVASTYRRDEYDKTWNMAGLNSPLYD